MTCQTYPHAAAAVFPTHARIIHVWFDTTEMLLSSLGDLMSFSPTSRSRPPPWSHRETMSRTAVTPVSLRNAHSQIVATRHPAANNSDRTVVSRITFALNFDSQNSGRVAGVLA